jgi:hypothetical protein
MPTKGARCRVAIPVPDGNTISPQAQAITALQTMCSAHGLTAVDVHLVSAGTWAESVGGGGPVDGYELHIYEATAA